jgi:hypothetical protein
MSMIPTTTGAARAVGEVLPELKGKLDGFGDPRADPERLGGRPDLHAKRDTTQGGGQRRCSRLRR